MWRRAANSWSVAGQFIAVKAGAFRLATFVRPEPLILPITVANLDTKTTRKTVVGLVHKRFKLSDLVPDPVDNQQLYAFLNTYQEQFAGSVRKALELDESINRPWPASRQ